jgi:type III restriction enzyme
MTTHADRTTFRNEDLVLKVTPNIDPSVWDETKYDAFLDELCGTREYQKSAIRTTLRYLLGGKYHSLKELAKENFDANYEIQQRYGSWTAMSKALQFPDQMACSIDLATGTGKSYVLFGLAAILLAEGAVDKVLVLCPSNTIESGLLSKFRDLAGSANLVDVLPATSKISTPRIINASESLVAGCICVENYHAILEHVNSSIRDNVVGQGEKIAVLSDEAHHIVTESQTVSKKWKDFLLSPNHGFRYLVGLSGTCYSGDDYFADVVARFSLREAMEQRYVKKVEYVSEMPVTGNADEKWQLVHKKHLDWKKKLKTRDIRPLTIVVTKEIGHCTRVAEELQSVLCELEGLTAEQAHKKILVVTSSREHQPNIAKLRSVDTDSSPVEWIVSVSMLSEGWDVKNVFQIVPHEERAFNSKLLIAQVLGRGLRVPDNWKGEDPVVTVFNHDAWSERIKHLVNEILERERRLSSSILPSSPYHFDLHSIDYTRDDDTSEFAKKGEYKLYDQGHIELPTQVIKEEVAIWFERAVTGERQRFKTQITHKTYSIEEVAKQMFLRLQSIDEESKDAEDPEDRTTYSSKFPLSQCESVVTESLQKAGIEGGRITEDNRQKFLQSLGTLRRKTAKRVIFRLKANALIIINTAMRHNDSCGSAELRRADKVIFYGPDAEKNIPEDQIEFFKEVADPAGEYTGGREPIENSHDFKTPVNIAIADANPEKRFIKKLCERDNASVITAWVKNTNQRFYSIEYAYRRRDHTKRGEFSPDFFIKQNDLISVVEIKDDSEAADPSHENQKKFEAATKHFETLNNWLEKEGSTIRYQFNFLTPRDYNKFFQQLRDGNLSGFASTLDVAFRTLSQEENGK